MSARKGYRVSIAALLGYALALFRSDRALLLPLGAATLFLPQFALLLLVPDFPALPQGPTTQRALEAWSQRAVIWAEHYGLWYALAPMVALFGALAIVALYLKHGRPTLAEALKRALWLFPRYLGASMLMAAPVGVAMLPALAAPMLLLVVLAPIFYLFGRMMLLAPVIVAEEPIGAVGAIGRSWALTAGNGWTLAALYAVVALVAQLTGSVFLALGAVARGAGEANPVIAALAAALAAAPPAAAALALALVEVGLYRALARKGM